MTDPLSPRQRQAIAEATVRMNLWQGAIRSGKTYSSLLAWLGYIARAPHGGELVMIGRTRDTIARNLFGQLTDPDLFGQFAQHVRYNPGAATATVLGRTVHVIGASDTKAEKVLRGLTCAGAYVDELTVIPEEVFTQLLGRMSVPGAQCLATTNPDSPASWVKRRYLDRLGALPDWRTWRFQLDDNPKLTDEFKASIRREFTGLWWRRFIAGEWVVAEGAVFPFWDPARHTVTELPRLRWRIAVGVDYGTANPTHALELALGTDNRLYLTSEWRNDPGAGEQQLTDAELSKRLRGWMGAHPPAHVIVDPSAASLKMQLWRDGVAGVVDGDNAVLDGIRVLSSLLVTGQLLVHESCRALIEEIPGYSWDPKAVERGEDAPLKVNDHGVDAARYLALTTQWLWHDLIRAPLSTQPAAGELH